MRYLALEQPLSQCHSAVICDVLDRMDRRAQCMTPQIRPMLASMRVWGEAVTARFDAVDRIPDRPFELEMALTDSLCEGQVLVSQCDSSSQPAAAWGGLLTAAARNRGARGVVTDGRVRDYAEIAEQRFPTFCTGLTPYDSLGRMDVAAINIPIVCGGVAVRQGDLVFGDADGVVVVPAEIAHRVIALAGEKMSAESAVRNRLRSGASVSETYREYGTL